MTFGIDLFTSTVTLVVQYKYYVYLSAINTNTLSQKMARVLGSF